MSINKKATIVSAVFVSSVFLSGCGLFGGSGKEQIDPPKSVAYEEDQTSIEDQTDMETAGSDQAVTNTVQTELYLINKDGLVVPQTLNLPKTESVATQALEHLVKDGPVTEMLPNGFMAVLPVDTKLSVDIKDKVATVNFSKEFKEYQAEEELNILQSVTWTLTQFDSIDKVKFKLNGHELNEMPVNSTPIGEAYSRSNGINLDITDVIDIRNTKPVTVYYIGGEEDSYYYVPVTKRVSNNEKNNLTAVVNELVKGPNVNSNLDSDFLSDVKLLDEPKIENGKVTLNFNESVFSSFEEKIISKHLLNALVLSLTEQKGIESVAITVNGKSDVISETGEKMTEPVTRPQKVNTGSF
ncbi:GerMN domain-containing protein [Bacillus sp. DTU_2020_1000418_1_SI_GHA_SEK_038]|uniref:GerMN domain-containing protein n=1 Tax=Bacillus sp. DTU_2020_1000418_1_SI_GHA_SEK_038 TaxID=3077585 RepID=UPI0028E4D2C4|nr:GerMN domain-containing protein [Bacillus sp. DTU_2020_1000418_1_SI_GHA_SEK_038]WNS74509.1 GerMN domain-containing protein [Bacillus sp. DTU_2020_1000418_1_SI_GHA_SEK_038]